MANPRYRKSEFQSPRNRVKCSELSINALAKALGKTFQSPRNRVKCSEGTRGDRGSPHF